MDSILKMRVYCLGGMDRLRRCGVFVCFGRFWQVVFPEAREAETGLVFVVLKMSGVLKMSVEWMAD